jgi:hypothetical protein
LERRRPDVIIHRRGTHDTNLLVVEVKRIGMTWTARSIRFSGTGSRHRSFTRSARWS